MRAATHLCHWPGCREVVPPRMFACKPHWYALPRSIRDEIWRTYRPGQEVMKTPSPEYIAAAQAAQDWIRTRALPEKTFARTFNERHERD